MFDLITGWIGAAGHWGVAALMLLENVFPPIPSELVMPLAGFQAARGILDPLWVVLAGTAGSVLGALLWFWVGLALGRARFLSFVERHGLWLTLDRAEAERALDWFDRHGGMAVFFGRMVPGVRTLISVPAGMARMPFLPFLGWTTLGSALWVGLLTAAGYVLESQYQRVASWLDPVTTLLVVGLAATYFWRLFRKLSVRASGS